MRTTVSEHVVESLKNDQGDHMKVRTCTFASQNSKNARLTRHGTNEFSTQKARMDPETLLLMVKSTQPSCTLRHTEHAPLLHSSSSRTALGQPAARKSRLGGPGGRRKWGKRGMGEGGTEGGVQSRRKGWGPHLCCSDLWQVPLPHWRSDHHDTHSDDDTGTATANKVFFCEWY